MIRLLGWLFVGRKCWCGRRGKHRHPRYRSFTWGWIA